MVTTCTVYCKQAQHPFQAGPEKNLSSYGLVKDDYRIVATKLSKVP